MLTFLFRALWWLLRTAVIVGGIVFVGRYLLSRWNDKKNADTVQRLAKTAESGNLSDICAYLRTNVGYVQGRDYDEVLANVNRLCVNYPKLQEVFSQYLTDLISINEGKRDGETFYRLGVIYRNGYSYEKERLIVPDENAAKSLFEAALILKYWAAAIYLGDRKSLEKALAEGYEPARKGLADYWHHEYSQSVSQILKTRTNSDNLSVNNLNILWEYAGNCLQKQIFYGDTNIKNSIEWLERAATHIQELDAYERAHRVENLQSMGYDSPYFYEKGSKEYKAAVNKWALDSVTSALNGHFFRFDAEEEAVASAYEVLHQFGLDDSFEIEYTRENGEYKNVKFRSR